MCVFRVIEYQVYTNFMHW